MYLDIIFPAPVTGALAEELVVGEITTYNMF